MKIECRKVYVRIRKNLNILSTFGVDYKKKKININEKCSHSYRKLPLSFFIVRIILQFSYLYEHVCYTYTLTREHLVPIYIQHTLSNPLQPVYDVLTA